MVYGARCVVNMPCERGTEPVGAIQSLDPACLLQEVGRNIGSQKGGLFYSGQKVEGCDFQLVDKRGRVSEEGDESERVDLWRLGWQFGDGTDEDFKWMERMFPNFDRALVYLCGHEPRRRPVRCHSLLIYFLLARRDTGRTGRILLLAGRRLGFCIKM